MAFRAVTSFGYVPKKAQRSRIITEGQIVSDDDPAVKKCPQWFVPLEDHLRSVEEASASPGSRRQLDTVIAPSKRGKK